MKKGFTLLELIMVVIILGILVSIAIPTLSGPRRRAYSAEALNILGPLRGAQLRYYEQQTTPAYATVCSSLDTTVAAPRYNAAPTCTNTADRIVSVACNVAGTVYCLAINANGEVRCTGAQCADVGYTNTVGACP